MPAFTTDAAQVYAASRLFASMVEYGQSLAIAHPVGQIRDIVHRSATENHTKIDVYPTIDEAIDVLTGPGSETPTTR